MIRAGQQNGFILLPVVLMITLIAAIAFLINNDTNININMTAAETEADRAQEVARAGLAHTTWGVQNSGCAGDMSMSTVPFGEGNYTATVDSAATTTQYTLNPDRDTYIREINPDTNFGTEPGISAGINRRALIHFDLASIAAGARVVSATLWLHISINDPDAAINIHSVTADWTEAGATWNTTASGYNSAVFGVIPPQPALNAWVAVNLTALTQSWVNDAAANHGLMLIGESLTIASKFNSREHSNSAQRPYLQITTADAPVSPVQITTTGTLTGNPSPANDITRTLTRTDVPAYQPPGTITLQLGTDSGEDIFLDSFYSARNHGGADYLQVHDNGSDWQQYPLIRFDLAGLPPGAAVRSAQLELNLQSLNAPGTATIHQVTRSWVEGTKSGTGIADGATWLTHDGTNAWTTAGGDINASVVAETAINGGETWVSWEIAPLVERWLAGEPNYGLLIKPDSGLEQANFASKEDTNAGVQPKLTITYACECGSPCLGVQGNGNVLMFVVNPTILVPADAYKKALFESWGYTVEVISESANQTTIDAAVVNNDVVYVSNTVNSNTLGTRLAGVPIGAVTEDGDYNSDLGFATGSGYAVGSAIDVTDASHYITALFPTGPLDIYAAAMEQLTVSGTEAPGLQPLADSGGAGSLVVLAKGADMAGGGSAAGHRVMLPLGRVANFNWDYLNASGRLIVQRALQWGTGNTGETPDLTYRDEFTNRNCNAADYTGSDGALDWSPWAWLEIGDDGAPCSGNVRIAEDAEISDPGNYRISMQGGGITIERQSDLSGFSSAYLVFDYRRQGVGNPPDALIVSVSGDGGSTWNEIDQIQGPATDSAFQSASHDISAYISVDTVIRFETIIGNADTVYIDNVQISETAPSPASLNLLLVVGDAAALSSKESATKALFESWGYAVTTITASASQADYDTALAGVEVAYVSGTISSADLNTKLKAATVGVVSEDSGTLDDMGLAEPVFVNRSTQFINIIDNTHYVTSGLSIGDLAIVSSSISIWTVNGALAPGLQVLGETQVGGTGYPPGVAVMETGAALWGGGSAAGRRVQVPWSQGSATFDVSMLNADGLSIMRRALEWAGGAGPAPAPTYNVLLIVGNLTLSSKDIGYKALMESWGHTVTLIDDGDSQANYDTAMAAADVVYASGSALGSTIQDKATNTTKGLVNEVSGKIDNFGFSSVTSATANFDTFSKTDAAHYITEPFSGNPVTVFTASLTNPVPGGTLAPDLSNVGEVSGTLALVTLDTGATRYDSNPSQGRRVHLPFAAAETTDLTADGETILQRTLEWAAGAGSGGGGGGGGGPTGVVLEAFTEAALSNGTSLVIDKPNGTSSGDLLVAAVATDGNTVGSLAPPAGWYVVDLTSQGGAVTFAVWWKLASTSESSTYTFGWTGNEHAYGWVMRFSGHDPANPINASSNTGGTSSAPTSPAVTTTVADALVLRLGGFDDDDIDTGVPGLAGHTEINMGDSGNGPATASGGSGYVLQPAAGDSNTSAFALTASEEYRAVTIAIAPAP